MSLKNKYLFFILLLCPLLIQAQSSEEWRNKNWNPKKGNYFFNKMLSWRFVDEMSEDEDFREGININVYIDEKTGTFLFTPEAYVNSGPMIDFIIADQNGKYIVGYSLEHDGKGYEIYAMEDVAKLKQNPNQQPENFARFFKNTGKKKIFGENRYGWPTLTGDEYKIVFPDIEEEPTVAHIAPMPYSLLPIYKFNDLGIEAKLPFHFDYADFIPSNQLLLSEHSENNDRKTELVFDSFSDAEYYINLNEYKKLKQ